MLGPHMQTSCLLSLDTETQKAGTCANVWTAFPPAHHFCSSCHGNTQTNQGIHVCLMSAGTSSASRPPGKRKMVRRLSDTGSSNYPLFDVLECGPAWDFTPGGTRVLIVANGLDEKQMKEACGHLHVMFDRTEVKPSCCWQQHKHMCGY